MTAGQSVPKPGEGIDLRLFGWPELRARLPFKGGAPFFKRLGKNLAVVAAARTLSQPVGGSSELVRLGTVESVDDERHTHFFHIVDGVLTSAGVLLPDAECALMDKVKLQTVFNQEAAAGLTVPNSDDLQMLLGILLKVTGKVN